MHGFDPHTPSIARVYDYMLGGKDHLAADRKIGEEIVAIYPAAPDILAEHRRFFGRAVAWVARQGISQFIDLGCGMPAEPSTHELAQAASPGARVTYVDVDPVALTHLRAFAEHGNESVTVMWGDATDVSGVIKGAAAAIDMSAPVCLLMGCLLHFFPAADARDLVAGYAEALPPGSCLVLSVGRGDGPRIDACFSTYSDGAAPAYNYSPEEVTALFGPLPLMPPGVVEARHWYPDDEENSPAEVREGQILVGVAWVDR